MLLDLLPRLNSWKIILASTSPRRKDILTTLGLKFAVVASSFEENLDKSKFSPQEYVIQTARGKAKEVFAAHTDADMVIGADTMIVFQNDILGKPKTEGEAFETLSSLSGKSHQVLTGVSIFFRESSGVQISEQSFCESTTVTFADLPPSLIDAYIKSGEPMDKAGAYGIQAVGGSFVTGIHGCYYNVVGFPMHTFCKNLRAVVRPAASAEEGHSSERKE